MREAGFINWRHVFKLDPDRSLDDASLEALCLSGTDAIMVGGSSGVTFDNTVELMSRIRRFALPCALEVTAAEAAVPGFDLYLIPLVLNAQRGEWVTGRQAAAIAEYGAFIPWEDVCAEGYIILNAEAEAAKLTKAATAIDDDVVLGYVRLADRLMKLSIVYMEYSGSYGDMQLVARAKRMLTQAQLFYGGGIDSVDKARQAAAAADTVIVGNVIYSDLAAALATVQAVKNAADRQ